MEILVRVSIWAAVLCWAIALGLRLTAGSRDLARIFWSAGVLAFVIHTASAFQASYGWSHAIAFQETARQTEEVTGRETGFGLWLNYLFGVVWLADAVFWLGGGHDRYLGRSRWISFLVDAFLIFMIFNGTVVFVEGPARWIGIVVFVILAALWLHARIRSRAAPKNHAGS